MTTPAPVNAPTRITTERGRYYVTPEGRQLPSVTTILGVVGKPGLDYWIAKTERESVVRAAQDLAEELESRQDPSISAGFASALRDRVGREPAFRRVITEAGDLGTSVHALIEWSLRRELGETVDRQPPVKLNERGLWAFMAYEQWRKTVSLKPLAVEGMLWSDVHGYAGTMDLLGEVTIEDTRALAIIDWKTGGIYPESLLQSAAYVKAAVERGLAKPPLHGLVVHLPKSQKDAVKVRLLRWEEIEETFEAFLAAKALWQWKNASRAVKEKEADDARPNDEDPQRLAAGYRTTPRRRRHLRDDPIRRGSVSTPAGVPVETRLRARAAHTPGADMPNHAARHVPTLDERNQPPLRARAESPAFRASAYRHRTNAVHEGEEGGSVTKEYLRVRNWERFQHYRDRMPPWIKFHNSVLEDEAIATLPDTAKAHLVGIWLLASRLGNRIPNSPAFVGARINATEAVNLKLLTERGFLEREQVASEPLAGCSTVPDAVLAKPAESKNTPPPRTPKRSLVAAKSGEAQALSAGVVEVFAHWKAAMGVETPLDNETKRRIRARLVEGFGVADLKAAIDGCKSSTWHMGGNPDRKVFNDITTICRDGAQVRKFGALVKGSTPASAQDEPLPYFLKPEFIAEEDAAVAERVRRQKESQGE